MRLHRWERIEDLRLYRCSDPPVEAVDSGQSCWPGCGAEVTYLELSKSGLRDGSNLVLDMIHLLKERYA